MGIEEAAVAAIEAATLQIRAGMADNRNIKPTCEGIAAIVTAMNAPTFQEGDIDD